MCVFVCVCVRTHACMHICVSVERVQDVFLLSFFMCVCTCVCTCELECIFVRLMSDISISSVRMVLSCCSVV